MTDDQTPQVSVPAELLPAHEVDQFGKVKCNTCSQILDNKDLFDEHYVKAHDPATPEPTSEATPPVEEKPQRNEKGQFVEGNTVSVGNSGKPCSFCEKPFEIIQKIKLYGQWTRGKVDGKIHVPFLEELCDEDYLDISEDTITNWVEHAHDEVAHAELIRAIKTLMMRQKGFLKKRVLGDKNPTGGIFLLKANHGLIETEKQMLVGGQQGDQPVRYDIRIVPKKKRGEDE